MHYTNKLNLPDSIVEAVKASDAEYDKGDCEYSVTQLIDSPRIVALKNQYADRLEEDIGDCLWKLMGSIGHGILEKADTSALTEERLYAEVNGVKISGMFDRFVFADGVLGDYKITSVWEYVHGVKFERVAQLNLLAHLLRETGAKVNKLEVIFIFRDWMKSKAKYDKGDYPQQQVAVVEVDLWPDKIAEEYLKKRVVHHVAARHALPLCKDEERWKKDDAYAVMKKGRKSALRVLKTEEEAFKWAFDKGHTILSDNPKHPDDMGILNSNITIEHRKGKYTRCEDYCPVADVCSQFQEEKLNILSP